MALRVRLPSVTIDDHQCTCTGIVEGACPLAEAATDLKPPGLAGSSVTTEGNGGARARAVCTPLCPRRRDRPGQARPAARRGQRLRPDRPLLPRKPPASSCVNLIAARKRAPNNGCGGSSSGAHRPDAKSGHGKTTAILCRSSITMSFGDKTPCCELRLASETSAQQSSESGATFQSKRESSRARTMTRRDVTAHAARIVPSDMWPRR